MSKLQKERAAAALKALWNDPEFRARKSAATAARWAELRAGKNKPAVIPMKERWADPEWRAQQVLNIKKGVARGKRRAKNPFANNAQLAQHHSTRLKELWKDPDYRQRMLNAVHNPETKAKIKTSHLEVRLRAIKVETASQIDRIHKWQLSKLERDLDRTLD